MRIIRFIKNWTLPISMTIGALSYFVYVNMPFLASTRPFVTHFIEILQPTLIFSMLFITFCKIEPKELHPCKWHLWLVLFQILSFALLAFLLVLYPNNDGRVVIEGAMLCLICPTATAAAVITGKLGGNSANLVTYTIISNLSAAFIAPLVLPIAHPQAGMDFWVAFRMIIMRVFPMLICPLLLAWAVRYFCAPLHRQILKCKDLAFYLWAVALAIAICVTVKSIVHSEINPIYEVSIAAVSLFCCIIQFLLGKKVGSHYDDRISGGQGLGQKNTVFAIWMGYTFLSPITSVAGGFYSVWHNVINSYQLYKKRKLDESKNIGC